MLSQVSALKKKKKQFVRVRRRRRPLINVSVNVTKAEVPGLSSFRSFRLSRDFCRVEEKKKKKNPHLGT